MGPRPGSLIRYAEVAAAPWHNGGGRTRELHAGEGWRLSVATIAEAGEFSAFPGRERALVVGRGRLVLSVGPERERHLTVGDRADFAGEAAVEASPMGGPVVAVNVMTERMRRTASVRVARLDGPAPAAAALVLLTGAASVQREGRDAAELDPFDTVLHPAPGAVTGRGALVVVVSIEEGQS